MASLVSKFMNQSRNPMGDLVSSITELLKTLIAIPSVSKEEDKTADAITSFMEHHHVPTDRLGNNVWAKNQHFRDDLPTILLNSHHDTVKPVAGWTKNPHNPLLENDKLYGLGSNDAGGSLVALIGAFLHFYNRTDLPFNLIMAATAEEEISGANGIASLLPQLPEIAIGIVGEPTLLQPAIAEKGLMVIDGMAHGRAGHAARNEGVNAIYIALEDIKKIRDYEFPKVSPLLGAVKATVTQISAGTQHNVVPDACQFVIDVRSNECYKNEEIHGLLQGVVKSELTARSYRLNSSGIEEGHPLVRRAMTLSLKPFGSPTLSDQALMSFPTLKIGCGDSARSHTADEFIYLREIEEGVNLYIRLLEGLHI